MHSFLANLAVASICYFIFHRWEPCSPWSLTALLLAPPPLVQFFSVGYGSLLEAYVIHYGIIIALTLAYRLSPFHPLAKFPGPRIGAMTKLWLAFVSRSGKQHLYLQKLHMQYGDIVRTGPNDLSFADPKYIGPMMGTNGMPKGPYWDGRFRDLPTKGIVGLRDPVEHTRRRQRWQRGFTTQALQGYEVVIEKRATQLVDSLSKFAGGPLDLMEWLNRFAFDFMVDMTFNGGSEMLRDGDHQGLWHILESAQPDSLFVSYVPWFAEFMIRLPFLNKSIMAFRQMAKDRCVERVKGGAMNRDLMYFLTDEEGLEEKPPLLSEVIPDSIVAFLAGTDTTATALSCLFYLLMSHPEKYKRLQEEVDTTTEYSFDTATNASMPYLNACINESLRLFPPTPSGSARAPIIGSGGHALNEHFIPEGTSTFMHFYTMQRDPRNFSYPESFLPERWLPTSLPYAIHRKGNGTEEFKHNATAFIPFSYGPANCIGKQLAMQEMRVVLRIMVERFNMRFADGYDRSNWEKDFLDYFVVLKGKLPVVLEARSKM